jgi:predicted GH43/DUF377 family glycosyl hydrolase
MRFLLLFFCQALFSFQVDLEELPKKQIVLETKRLYFPQFHDAFNPSMIKLDEGYLLVFRHCPNVFWDPWTNEMYAVFLNRDFEPTSEPQLLATYRPSPCVKQQSEDPRIFTHDGKFYIIYNDNIDISRPWFRDRRDMFLAEVKISKNLIWLDTPVKLFYEKRYHSALWQKNWSPFVWNGQLLFSYLMNPHEIIYPNLEDGTCFHCYETESHLPWTLGVPRGSAIPELVDGEYLSFFHAGHQVETAVSQKMPLWHYFMGAYTFSATPPFQITKMTPQPIVGEGFYTHSDHPLHYLDKKVILPGSFIVDGDRIYVAYGRDDCEMWIATLDKEALMKELVPVRAE